MIYRIKGSDLQAYRSRQDRPRRGPQARPDRANSRDPKSSIRCLRISRMAPSHLRAAALERHRLCGAASRSAAARRWTPSPRSSRSTSSPAGTTTASSRAARTSWCPASSLKLRNKTDKPLKSIQINAIFRRVGEQEMWGEYFGWAIPRTEPLPAGAETKTLVMRSTLGYTGEQPRMQMLQNTRVRRRQGRDLSEAGIEGPRRSSPSTRSSGSCSRDSRRISVP